MRLVVIGSRENGCLRNPGGHLVNLLNPVQFLITREDFNNTDQLPLFPLVKDHFATERL